MQKNKKDNLLANRIKELRIAAGYTQEYVASAIGVVRQTYGHYENGIRTPRPRMLYNLSHIYNISVDDLLSLKDDSDDSVFDNASVITETTAEVEKYLDFINASGNIQTLKNLDADEKRMIFYMRQLSEKDCSELIQIARLKLSLSNES